MMKRVSLLLLTLILIINTMSAVSLTASAANNSKQLMVVGNQLVYVDEPTKTVRLTGVNVPGGEWTGTPGVERIERSVTWAIDNWYANIIRLPVDYTGWSGAYSYVYDGGNSYRNYIDSVISIASDRGVYVILDFHEYKSFNNEEYITFWQEAAVRYMNNPTVLFGILNEPHSTTWDVWRNGDGDSVYGHQYVVEMIRDLGAKNIIVAGGLEWGYTLDGVSTGGYALVDQGSDNNKANTGYGIMYDSHIYPWKGHTANWDSKVGAARKLYPVLIGECGWDSGTINEIAGKDPQPGDALYHDIWVPELLAWMDDDTTYGAMANYTAYCMHPSSAPQLIVAPDADGNEWKSENYSYTPTEYWGAYLVPHLQASVNTRYGTTSAVKVATMSVVDAKTSYNVGDEFDESTGYLDVTCDDGTKKQVSLSDSSVLISGFDSSAVAESQTITITYSGVTTTYTITIADDTSATLSSISVSDVTTSYKVGDTFVNPTVTAKYSDGSTKTVTTATFAGYNMDVVGEQTVTVSYGGKSVTYSITVEAPDKIVESLTVSDAKTSYTWGDEFVEPTVTASYTNKYYPDEVVTGATFNNYNMSEVRTHTVRVIYGGKTTTYTITVSAPAKVIASITPVNPVTDYTVGDLFITPSVTVSYTSTYYSSISAIPTCTGYDMEKAGTQTVTATYGGATATYQIVVRTAATTDTEFIFAVGNVTAEKGATTVSVPLTIEKFFANETIGGFSVNLTYDTTKLSYTGMTFGSMIPNESDMDYAESTPGTIYIAFTTADQPITSAGIAADSLFATVNFDVLASGTSEIGIAAASKMTNNDLTTLVSKKNLADCLVSGSVTVEEDDEVVTPEVTLTSIAVSDAKTAYNAGDAFVAPTVTATYSDGTTKIVTDATFTGYNMSTAGEQTVTVTYDGKTTSYKITVTAATTDTEFIFAVGNVTAEKGATTVSVPLTIEKFFANETIGGFSVNLTYDTTKLSYTGMTFGSMIPNESDMDYAESTPGTIYIAFTTADQPITSAGIAADSLFATVNFDVLASGTSEIGIAAASKMTNNDLTTLVSKKNLADCLVSGSVTVEGKNSPGYNATVSAGKHWGFGNGYNKHFHYIKQFVLTEGNGKYIIKIGDYELVWSVERECYVGAADPDDYLVDENSFSNVTITEGTPKTIKKYCDVTGDERINISDISAMKNYMELGIELIDAYAGDANIDGYLNISDFSIMRNYVELDTPIF